MSLYDFRAITQASLLTFSRLSGNPYPGISHKAETLWNEQAIRLNSTKVKLLNKKKRDPN